MDWFKIDVFTSSEGIEPVTGRLMNVGIGGFEITDSRVFEDFLAHKDGNWDYVEDDLYSLRTAETAVSFYIPDNEQGAEMLANARSQIAALKALDSENKYGRLEISSPRGIREEDWAENWKKYFKPFTVGSRLAVKPSWEEMQPDGRTMLEIDPGSSFGTGKHNTTMLCLEFLDSIIKGGERVLDLGCGSGILSIAALLLGADFAAATDIDENSVRIAAENAAKNGIPKEKYKAYCGNITANAGLREKLGGGYDIITANIVADVLIAMAPYFRSFMAENAVLIVSGIISQRADEVRSALHENGFVTVEERQSEDWLAIRLQ